MLKEKLVARNKITKKPEINTYCFRSVVKKLKWKNSNNKHHYKNRDPVIHYYSDIAVQDFIDKIMTIKDYLKKARKDNSNRSKKKGKG